VTEAKAGGPDLEVVVVAYGAPELLDACLGALDTTHPVVVVDNSSDPAVAAVAERHGVVYVDPGANLGFGGGVNLALRRPGRGRPDVLLLNPDAVIEPTAILALHRRLREDAGVACVAPAQVEPGDGTAVRVAWPFPSPAGAWLEAIGLGGLRRRPDFLIGSVLLIRGEALAEVGPFDERFFLYAEETDWQRRATREGWRVVWCPEISATHVGAGTGGDPTRRLTHFHASHERYMRKHFGPAGWQAYRAAVVLGSMVRGILLPGDRGRQAAVRFHLYLAGPCRREAELTPVGAAR
jgi:GT2 family glycosyltransferase